MSTNIGDSRALQVCDLCGGVDDHPRHTLAGGDAGKFEQPSGSVVAKVAQAAPEADRDRLVTELLDTGTTSRHLDCCRDAGCPTGDCDERLSGWNGETGKAVLEHIQMGA